MPVFAMSGCKDLRPLVSAGLLAGLLLGGGFGLQPSQARAAVNANEEPSPGREPSSAPTQGESPATGAPVDGAAPTGSPASSPRPTAQPSPEQVSPERNPSATPEPTGQPSAALSPRQPIPPSVQTLTQRSLLQHRVKLYVPPRHITAVVLLLHQYAATPEKVESDSQLVAYAARNGWLLAVPVGRGASWNAGLCCGKAREANLPDAAFIHELVGSLREQYVLDAHVPTVMGGVSNGAMLTAQVFCKYPGLLDGAFLDAGNLQDPSCSRGARVSRLLVTRGVNDPAVPTGGLTYSDYLHTRLLPDQVMLDAFRRGSICHVTSQFQRQGISSRTERCGDRVMRVIHDQAVHNRDNRYRPGIMNRVALTVDLILGVVRDKAAGRL